MPNFFIELAIRNLKPFIYSNFTVKNPLLPRFQEKNLKMQKRTRLGECYFELKGKTRTKDGRKKRTNREKERNGKKKSKIVNCQIGISFVLWPSFLKQLSS